MEEPTLVEELIEFRDDHLENRGDVTKYRKLRKYSKYGFYLSGFLVYSTTAIYFSSEFSIMSPTFIGFALITLTSMVLTVLFVMNRRGYSYDEYDLVYHEVAALINTVQHSSRDEDLTDDINRFEQYVIEEDDGVIPKIWREELDSFFEYVDERGEDEISESFESVFVPLVDTLDRLEGLDLEDEYKEDDTIRTQGLNKEPGFFGIVVDSLSSDVVSKELVIWTIFILAVGAGLILAFLQGQGWGVLLVTIVFGGLRLYDQQRE